MVNGAYTQWGSVRPLAVCFLNRKGGVGKTSSCFHTAGALADLGFRVLLVDMDPQASLTQGLLGVQEALALPKARTVAALFDDRLDPRPDAILVPTHVPNLTLAPSCAALNDYNLPRPEEYPGLQFALRQLLQEVGAATFDAVLIDCPPNLNLCSWNALLASQFVIVPLQAESYGGQGIVHVQQVIDVARAQQNPGLRLMGYLLTMISRLTIHSAYRQQLSELYGSQVFASCLPYLKDYKEAISYGLPVGRYKPDTAAATEARAVAREILARACSAGLGRPWQTAEEESVWLPPTGT